MANALRGEARLDLAGGAVLLRPSFAALVAAEDELGPLFALVERAAAGDLKLAEMAALFWHCRTDFDGDRDAFSESVVAAGLAACSPALKVLLTQILAGR
ncbi:MAG: GTA-gp10 family protein [Pacificimonas sp.]|jgi:hypothetical protein|nr:GTA-gp10 family protein [Pacificimonas sp.]